MRSCLIPYHLKPSLKNSLSRIRSLSRSWADSCCRVSQAKTGALSSVFYFSKKILACSERSTRESLIFDKWEEEYVALSHISTSPPSRSCKASQSPQWDHYVPANFMRMLNRDLVKTTIIRVNTSVHLDGYHGFHEGTACAIQENFRTTWGDPQSFLHLERIEVLD